MRLFVGVLVITMVVMATLIDDSECGCTNSRRRRRRRTSGLDKDMELREQVEEVRSLLEELAELDLAAVDLEDVDPDLEEDGDVTLHSYAPAANTLVRTFRHHKRAARAVAFSKDGNSLITSSKDRSLQVVDVETGKIGQSFPQAHPAPVYCQLVISERMVATGDDEGNLKLWDLRKGHPIMELQENQDYISDMAVDEEKRLLLTTSGDGTMTTFNIRRRKKVMQSENMEDELLSVAIVKEGSKVICGTGEGALNFFNWEEFGNISDRFPGHPMSVDCIVPVTENIVCTGSMDGVIRAVHILPNRFMGVVGEHEEFPIEQIRIAPNSEMIASCSHDHKIKFWHVAHLEQETIDASKKAKRDNKPKNLKKTGGHEDFFADFGKDLEVKPVTESEDDVDEDSDDDETEDVNGEDENDSEDEESEEFSSDVSDNEESEESEDFSSEDEDSRDLDTTESKGRTAGEETEGPKDKANSDKSDADDSEESEEFSSDDEDSRDVDNSDSAEDTTESKGRTADEKTEGPKDKSNSDKSGKL